MDLTPQILDAKTCKKQITTYAAFTIKKAVPRDAKDKPTWAKAEHVEERLSQGDISKEIKKLNEAKCKVVTVSEKKAALAHYQQGQISSLLDEQNNKEPIPDLEWTLAQIDRKEKSLKDGKKETTTMIVYLMRTTREGVDPIFVHSQLKRMEKDRMDSLTRPPPPPGPPGGGKPDSGIVKLPDGGPGGKGGKGGKAPSIIREPSRRPRRRHIDDSSTGSSGSESDSMSDSGTMSSNTSYTRSSGSKGHGRRRNSYNRGHNCSRSRYREHRRSYGIDRSPLSPRRHFGEVLDTGLPGLGIRAPHVPEVPRAAALDNAYHAGKMDADAERNGLAEQDRYQPAHSRPLIVERTVPVVIQEAREPRSLVPYSRRDRYYEPRYPEPPLSPRYDERRYFDERWVEEPVYRPRRDYARMERDAEDYIERPRRHSVFRDRQPFDPIALPRRYPAPPSDDSAGW